MLVCWCALLSTVLSEVRNSCLAAWCAASSVLALVADSLRVCVRVLVVGDCGVCVCVCSSCKWDTSANAVERVTVWVVWDVWDRFVA